MTEIFVSPDGKSEQPVDAPNVAVRLRARGWAPKDAPKGDQPSSRSEKSTTTTSKTTSK